MEKDSVGTDRKRLDEAVYQYLRSPEGANVIDEFVFPFGLKVIGTGLSLLGGLILLPTIVKTRLGLKLIWYALSLTPFRKDESRQFRKDPSPLHALIASSIIIGPDGRHGLVLGTFDREVEQDLDLLAR